MKEETEGADAPPHVQSLASPASMYPMLCQPFAAEAAKELATL